MLHLLLPFCVSSVIPLLPQLPVERHSLVRVAPAELAGRSDLLPALGFDHVARDPASGTLEFAASETELRALERASVRYRVAIDDLESYYASRLDSTLELTGAYGAWLSPPFAQGGMGGYYTYAQVGSVLDQIHTAYPGITTAKASLGTSVEGRSLWMLKVSDNPALDENEPEVRIDSLHHAREPEGMQASLWFLLYLVESYGTDPLATYLVDNRELYFVPVVNPDGYAYNQSTNPGGGGMWRKNRRPNGGGSFGVDLNRNYPDHWGWDDVGSSPFASDDTYRGPATASEPEVQALRNFIQSRQFQTALSIHTFSNLWLYPFGYDELYPANDAQYVELSQLATELNQYTYGPPWFLLYLANGVTADYDHDAKGTMCWSPEIGSSSDGFWPPTTRIIPLAEENLLAFQRTALAAGAYLRVLSTVQADVGDGDGFFEAGESARFTATVRNSGRLASATSAVLSLSTSSPWASVTAAAHDYGLLGSFAQANNAAAPLELAIQPGTPGGTAIDFELALACEGYVQLLPGQIVVGEPRAFLIDDAEVDWGWTKGVAGDTASTGIWTRANPIGTSSSGEPASPEDDASAQPGVQCFVTGNGGGSAGTDDVDGGATTLRSPVFDLSSVGTALLSYSRWFADLSVEDDVFRVSLSNDGGASWTPLESVAGNANAWTSANFDVASVLPLTAEMRLEFVAADSPNNSVVEAAVDELRVVIYDSAPRLSFYGQVAAGSNVKLNLSADPGARYLLQATFVDPSTIGSAGGKLLHPVSLFDVQAGLVPASGLAQVPYPVPASPQFSGQTLWMRAVVRSSSSYQTSNWDSLTIP